MSYAFSDYHKLFVEAGYPLHDLVDFGDGEWAVREFHRYPLIPSLTPWSWVLKGIRHQEKSFSFISNQLRALDPRLPAFWVKQIEKTLEVEVEKLNQERFVEEAVDHTLARLRKNEALWERIARHGVGELDLRTLAGHVAKNQPSRARSHGITVRS